MSKTEGGWMEEERNGRQWNDGEREEEREGEDKSFAAVVKSHSLRRPLSSPSLSSVPAVRALVEISPG